MHKLIGRLLAVLALAGGPGPAVAMRLDFDFKFTDTANGGNFVQGMVLGLEDNATSTPISLIVTANSGGYGVGTYLPDNAGDYWTLLDGTITDYHSQSPGVLQQAPYVTCCTLSLVNGTAGLTDQPDSSRHALTIVTFTNRADIPAPTTTALCALALVGLGLSRHKRRLQS